MSTLKLKKKKTMATIASIYSSFAILFGFTVVVIFEVTESGLKFPAHFN